MMAVKDSERQVTTKAGLPEWLSKKFLVLLRCVARVPKVDHKKIQTIIMQAPAEAKQSLELQHEELRSGEQSKLAIISVTMSILYTMKNLFALFRTAEWFDYTDLESNFKSVTGSGSDASMLEFACMTTNCTRISSSSRPLIEDLAELPVFEICDPTFASLFMAPAKYLTQLGMLYFALTALSSFLNGTFITTMQWLRPAGNECLVFIQAPDIGVELIKQRVRDLIRVEFLCCFERFAASSMVRCSCPGSLGRYYEGSAPLSMRRTVLGISSRAAVKNLRCRMLPGTPDSDRDPRESMIRQCKEQLIDSCVPAVRTNWFRSNLMGALVASTVYNATVGLILFVISFWIFIQPLTMEKAKQLHNFSLEVRHSNCSIWLTSEHGQSSASSVNFWSFDLSWHPIAAAEAFLLQLIPSIIVISMTLVFYVNAVELICWQAELQNQLLLLIDCKRLISRVNNLPIMLNNNRSTLNHHAARAHLIEDETILLRLFMQSDSVLADLRAKFKETNRFVPLMNTGLINTKRSINSSSRFENMLALRELSTSLLINHQFDSESEYYKNDDDNMKLVLIMERVYINLRLYLDHVEHCIPCISLIISFCYVLFYSFVLVAIWYCKKMNGSILESLLIMCIGWVLTNAVLLVASHVHAKGKRLHPLIWSLIAQLNDSQHQHEDYLRHLWIKHIERIDGEGGVALKAMGVKITFVRMIQLMICTASLFVFALRL